MPTIWIDETVFEELQKRAVPLKDNSNSVLRRVFGIEADGKRDLRSKPVGANAREKYRRAIVKVLVNMGGKGPTGRVVDDLGELVRSALKPEDHDPIASGEVRWRNSVRWERQRMVKEGFLKSNSPHGVWELTEKGRKYLAEE